MTRTCSSIAAHSTLVISLQKALFLAVEDEYVQLRLYVLYTICISNTNSKTQKIDPSSRRFCISSASYFFASIFSKVYDKLYQHTYAAAVVLQSYSPTLNNKQSYKRKVFLSK